MRERQLTFALVGAVVSEETRGRHRDLVRAHLARNDADCPRCGYNLRGLNEPRCPECGSGVDAEWLLDPWRPQGSYALWAADWRFCLVVNIVLAAGTLIGVAISLEEDGAGLWSRISKLLFLADLAVVFPPILLWHRLESHSRPAELLGERCTARILRAAPFVCGVITLAHALAMLCVWL